MVGIVVALGALVVLALPASAQGGLAQLNPPQPMIEVSSSTAVVSWSNPGGATAYNVDATDGAICDVFDDGATIGQTVANSTSCEIPGGGDELCVAVQAVDEFGQNPSKFSNWLCVTADPFYVGVDFAAAERTVGWVREQSTLPATDPTQECLVDFATTPARFVCASSVDAAVGDLTGQPGVTDRVIWVGESGDTLVADYDPEPLNADIGITTATLRERPVSPGDDITLTYNIANFGTDAAPTVGFQVRLSSFIELTATPPDCSRVAKWVSCFVGELDPGANRDLVFQATIDPDATPEDLAGIEFAAFVTSDVGGTRNDGDPDGVSGRSDTMDLIENFDDDVEDPTNPTPCVGCLSVIAPGRPGTATTFSHPNLVTFDGRRYIFHGAGDYVLAESTSDDFAVHVRFSRMDSTTVSFNRAIAATVGDSTISFGDDAVSMAWDDSVVRLDGEVITPTSTPTDLPGGATITLVNGMHQVDWPDGTRLRAGLRVADPWNFTVGEPRWAQMRGLLGNADGDRMDDLVAADATPFEYNSMELYTIFGASWLLDDASTMFDSELAPIDRLPIIPSAVITLADLPPSAVAWADQLCRNAGVVDGAGLAECIFDVALTGDPRWITGINIVDDIVAQSISVLADLGLIEDDTAVTVPEVLYGSIDTPGSIDLYRFDLEAGDSITINSSRDCTNRFSFEFALEAPGGYFVGRSQGVNCGRLGLFDLPETGTYVLRVYDTAEYTGQYSLSVQLPPSVTRSYEFDEVGSGSQQAGEETFFVFDVPEGGIDGYVEGISCDVLADYQLFDPSGSVVRSGSCRNDYPFSFAEGTWTLRMVADTARTNNFSFRIWDLPERQDPLPLDFDTTVEGSLSFPTDRHAYTFDVPAGGVDAFLDILSCRWAGIAGQWRLRNPSGSVAFSSTVCRDQAMSLTEGTWTLEFYSDDPFYGFYRFRLWDLPEPRDPVAAEFDTTVEDSLSFPTDVHAYTFEVPAGGADAFLDILSCRWAGISGQWRLRNPAGSVTVTETLCRDRALTLTEGTWTLEFYSDDAQFGLYRFRLWDLPEPRDPVPILLGETVADSLGFPTDVHRYEFVIPAGGQTVTVDVLSCRWAGISGQWRLREASGSVVAGDTLCRDRTIGLGEGVWSFEMYSDDQAFGFYEFVIG